MIVRAAICITVSINVRVIVTVGGNASVAIIVIIVSATVPCTPLLVFLLLLVSPLVQLLEVVIALPQLAVLLSLPCHC